MATTKPRPAPKAKAKRPSRAAPPPAGTRAQAAAERRLLASVARKATREQASRDAIAQHDHDVRAALGVGVTRARIGEITGLCHQRIAQISRGARL